VKNKNERDLKLWWIEIYATPTDDKIFHATTERLRRVGNLHRHVGWYIIDSTTEPDRAWRLRLLTGEQGRPRRIVRGKKVTRHLHIGVLSLSLDGRSAFGFLDEFKKRTNRAYGRKVTRYFATVDDDHARRYLAYCFRQADAYRQSGFDFKKLADELGTALVIDEELFTRDDFADETENA